MVPPFYEKLRRYFPLILLLGIGTGIALLAMHNELWEGGADNYWHYYFSRYAYSHPKFFLHHWGKPIFIFLSAPFSQFGFYGLNIFNICCGLGGAYVCYVFSKALGFKTPSMAIVLTLFMPIYFLVMQSAMTECLFSLLFICSAYLLFKERFVWGAVIGSFLIYSRTEGLFFIPIYALYLILGRNWKYLPFLFTAFIIYSLAGFFSGHDLLWFFTENPYSEQSAYGNGPWDHFLQRYRYIIALPEALLCMAGILLLLIFWFWNREWDIRHGLKPRTKVLVLIVMPAVIFSAFHVYAWAMGKYASAGLERVFACVVPALALIGMYAVDGLQRLPFHRYVKAALNLVICFFVVKSTFLSYSYPLKGWGPEVTCRKAAKWFKSIRKPGQQVYYCHPGTIFFCDYNPFGSDIKECMQFNNACPFPKGTPPFYYIWDSFFTPGTCGVKLEDYKNCGQLELMREFDDGQNIHIAIFEYNPK
ncbi:MAG: hypothetical protein ACXVP0_07625 [Bacteroidia bacterium]